jgi:hypothetical protein
MLRLVFTLAGVAVIALMIGLSAIQVQFLIAVGPEGYAPMLVGGGLLIFNLAVAWIIGRATWRLWVQPGT